MVSVSSCSEILDLFDPGAEFWQQGGKTPGMWCNLNIFISTHFWGNDMIIPAENSKAILLYGLKRQRIQIASNTEGCRRWCDGELPSEECALDNSESLTDATPPQKSMDSRSHTWKMCSWNQKSDYIFQIIYGNPKNERNNIYIYIYYIYKCSFIQETMRHTKTALDSAEEWN